MLTENPELLRDIAPLIVAVVGFGVIGWVVTTWMRIKHGYPIESSMGEVIHPQIDHETADQIKLLNQENTQLRDELAAFKGRLANVERIVTDSGYVLDQKIQGLSSKAE